MIKTELTFGEKTVETSDLYKDTKLLSIEDVNIDKTELSKKKKTTNKQKIAKKFIIHILHRI